VPFIAVLASGAIVAAWRAWAAGQRPLGRSFLAVAGLVLLISPLTADLHQKYKGRAARSETIKTFRAFGKFVEDHIAPDEVVASDLSLVIAWYGQRTSMTLPMDLETARRVRKAYVPFTAIILTSQRVHNPHFVSDETWRRAYRGEAEPLGFAIRPRFEQGSLRAVLLRPKGWPDRVLGSPSPDGAQGS